MFKHYGCLLRDRIHQWFTPSKLPAIPIVRSPWSSEFRFTLNLFDLFPYFLGRTQYLYIWSLMLIVIVALNAQHNSLHTNTVHTIPLLCRPRTYPAISETHPPQSVHPKAIHPYPSTSPGTLCIGLPSLVKPTGSSPYFLMVSLPESARRRKIDGRVIYSMTIQKVQEASRSERRSSLFYSLSLFYLR